MNTSVEGIFCLSVTLQVRRSDCNPTGLRRRIIPAGGNGYRVIYTNLPKNKQNELLLGQPGLIRD
jgi:hypothetical protein